MSQKFCTQCGSGFVEAARFCTGCGAPRLDVGAAATAARPAAPQGPAAVSVPGDPSPLNRYAPLLVVLAVAVLVLGTVLLGLLSPKKAPEIVQRQGAAAPGQPAPGELPPGAEMPQDHPPLSIPEQVKQAIADLEKKAEANPQDLQTWTHLSEVLYRAGQIEGSYFDGARRAFEHILGIEPENLEAVRGLGNIAFEQNATDVAIGHYKKYLEKKPDDLSVRTDLGTMYLSANNVEEAVRTYDGVLKEEPTFFQAQFNLAIAYRTAGQDEAALAALRKAREFAPDDDTRNQIDQLLARADGSAAAAAAPQGQAPAAAAPAGGGDFRSSVETIFRTHSILASKVQRFDWKDDTNLTAVLTGFPMTQMPPDMRNMFLTRMKERIAAAKKERGVEATVTIDLVDFESGEKMDSIVE
jgi:tetratricopeptide (TPR) repeat protein